MPTPNSRYWFVLGRESLIAAAEIDAVLSLQKYDYSTQILKVDGLSLRGAISDAAIPQVSGGTTIQWDRHASLAMTNSKTLINRLGGTIKIARELAENITEKDLQKIIIDELKTVSGKINFGISFYNSTNITLKEIEIIGLQIKKVLKADGYSVRYVENKEEALSSVTVAKNGLTNRGREFLISPLFKEGAGGGQRYSLAKTEAVQPFEQFSARDFGRPGRDDLSGMLPPKLAMIMINLAQTSLNSILLDPFCGSGTILSEALLLGYKNLIGSDISEKAVEDTKINIDWIAKEFNKKISFQPPLVIPNPLHRGEESLSVIPRLGGVGVGETSECPVGSITSPTPGLEAYPAQAGNTDRDPSSSLRVSLPPTTGRAGGMTTAVEIFKSGVAELSKNLHANSIDAIVAEPLLGKPLRGQETKQELLKQASELKKLYLEAFTQFSKILKHQGKVVFIIPRFKYADEWITIDCKNEIEKIGFTALPFFEDQLRLVYSRPNQRVAREIWRFEKTPK